MKTYVYFGSEFEMVCRSFADMIESAGCEDLGYECEYKVCGCVYEAGDPDFCSCFASKEDHIRAAQELSSETSAVCWCETENVIRYVAHKTDLKNCGTKLGQAFAVILAGSSFKAL